MGFTIVDTSTVKLVERFAGTVMVRGKHTDVDDQVVAVHLGQRTLGPVGNAAIPEWTLADIPKYTYSAAATVTMASVSPGCGCYQTR